jgi:hypothetical protein
MACLSNSGGFSWGNNWGSNLADDYGEDVAADVNGESYQAANFGISIESVARRDNAGNGYWGVASTGATALAVQSMACDGAHNVYIGGSLVGSMTWNGASLGSSGSNDIYVSKWDLQSTQQWQFVLGGVGADAVQEIAIGPTNTVFIAGIFTGHVDFNPSFSATNYLTAVGGTDVFIMRLGATNVGIDDQITPSNSFYAYPNPASDVLTISFSKTAMTASTLRLYTFDGKCVMAKDISFSNESSQTLDISTLSPGMYLLDVQQGEKHEKQKIMKID